MGERFTGAKLPLDVLADLPAFRDLVVAFAKQRWRNLYADRQRVPKHFDRSLSFDLTAIEEGSAVPRLTWDRGSAQTRLPGFADELESIVRVAFDDVVQLVSEAANGNFPNVLPSEHVRALNRFGSGLRDHERIEFLDSSDRNGKVVYLDTASRKALITKVRETYLVRYEGVGVLIGTSAPNDDPAGSVTVQTSEYGSIQIPIERDRVVSEFDGHIDQQVQFELEVELDNRDGFRGVAELHGLTLINEQLAADLDRCRNRMIELAHLKDDWDDEGGRAIDARAIAAALAFLNKRPVLSSRYKIFPTAVGGVLFEFKANDWDLSVEIAPGGDVELFGFEINGKGELLPLRFDGIGDAFIDQFDEHVGRDGQ